MQFGEEASEAPEEPGPPSPPVPVPSREEVDVDSAEAGDRATYGG